MKSISPHGHKSQFHLGDQTERGRRAGRGRSPLQRSVCHYAVTPSNHMITPTEAAAAPHRSPLMMTRAGSGLLMMTRAGGVMKRCEVALAQGPRSRHRSVRHRRTNGRSEQLTAQHTQRPYIETWNNELKWTWTASGQTKNISATA